MRQFQEMREEARQRRLDREAAGVEYQTPGWISALGYIILLLFIATVIEAYTGGGIAVYQTVALFGVAHLLALGYNAD